MNIVQNLQPGDIQLIQGPPGTGKTETIAGIISLLLHKNGPDNNTIIQVCAPSNGAVDEILSRVKDRGLIGITNDEETLKQMMVRVVAREYEPTEQIKMFTLSSQIEEIALAEKLEEI